jgi:hypothetical protein
VDTAYTYQHSPIDGVLIYKIKNRGDFHKKRKRDSPCQKAGSDRSLSSRGQQVFGSARAEHTDSSTGSSFAIWEFGVEIGVEDCME